MSNDKVLYFVMNSLTLNKGVKDYVDNDMKVIIIGK